MGQPKKETSVEQVLKLAEQLSPRQQGELRHRLEASWGDQWDALVARVAENNKGLPLLTEEEIYAEFTEYRREQRAKRAQSGN